MKSFRFRQEKLLRLKQKKKQQVEMDVARLNVAIQNCETTIQKALTELDDYTHQAMNRKNKANVSSIEAIQGSQQHVRHLRNDLAEHETKRQSALQSLLVVSKEVKTLESLRDNKFSEYQSEVEAQRQREADEHAQNKHLSKLRLSRREENNG